MTNERHQILARMVLVLALAGCGTTTAHVTVGEPVQTGNASYDEFFTAVSEVRSQSLGASAEEHTSHGPLIEALGLEAQAPVSLTLQEAAERAKRLREAGLLLHLDLTPEAKLLVSKGKADLGAEGETVLKAMEDAARAALDLRRRFADLSARASELNKRRSTLRAEAPQIFRAERQAQRDEIIVELDASEAVLTRAADAANQMAGAASRFALELAQAIETGARESTRNALGSSGSSPAARTQTPPATAPASKRPAAKPAIGPTPAPPPKKAAKKKGGDDFEP